MACGANQTAQVYIDGVEHTGIAVAGSWTPTLNHPAQASVTIDMETDAGDTGSLLMITLDDDEVVFHGPILNWELAAGKDEGSVVYNAQDHMELWQHRVVRDAECDFSKPTIITDEMTGPQILEAALTYTQEPACSGGVIPQDAEGPIFLELGYFAIGGPDLSGAPTDWPMTIMDLFQLLVSTGQLDAIITYISSTDGTTGIVDGYNGNYGTDVSGSVSFDYGTGNYSAEAIRWNKDATNVCNKYWLYGGPRIGTAADPQGDQHWCFNVTGDDGGLAYPPGGALSPPASSTNNSLGVKRVASQAQYGVRMKVDVDDAYDGDCVPGIGTPGRELSRYRWQTYSWLAAEARQIIHFTPADDRYLGCFGIGDIVGVSATALAKGGFSGAQRVFGYTVSWEATPSVLTLSEVQTSADAEVGS